MGSWSAVRRGDVREVDRKLAAGSAFPYPEPMSTRPLIRVVALALLLVPAYLSAEPGTTYSATLVKVIDGDTLKLDVAIWPGLTQRISLRLNGIDTPEKRGSPPCEKELAKQATEFTRRFVAGGTVTVSEVKLGKYAGGALGRVSVDGRDLAEALIEAGHGRAYDGGARGSWCE